MSNCIHGFPKQYCPQERTDDKREMNLMIEGLHDLSIRAEKYEKALRDVEVHLEAIAMSPAAMGESDIDSLHAALLIIRRVKESLPKKAREALRKP